MFRPNILVLMTDQQHHAAALQQHPGTLANLRRLQARGTTFVNAFCPTPICSPSRASVQTGLLPHRHGLLHNTHKQYHVKADLEPGVPTLGSTLSAAGYATTYVGKWHVGKHLGPVDHGYRQAVSPVPGRSPWEGLREAVVIPGEGMRAVISGISNQPPEESEARRVADCVCETIRRAGDQPFFIFASTTAPHVPWLCPREYAGRVAPDAIPRPASFDDDMRGRPTGYHRHHNMHNDCRLDGRWPDMAVSLSRYYGIMELIDDALGRILDSLQAAGHLDDTLLVFCSDHGEMAGAHAMVGKGEYLLDDVLRVPLVVAPPGGSPRRVATEFVTLTDLFATVLDAAGVARPVPPESRSLMPLLASPADWPEEVFAEHNGSLFHTSIRGIRTRDFKYVFRPHELDELYDLRHDPGECHNEIGNPALAGTLQDLRRRLVDWMERTGDMTATGARYTLLEPQSVKGGTHAHATCQT